MRAPQVNCLEGNTFMVSDLIGDVGPDSDQVFGLFYRDMRHLSRWQLAIDGGRLETLSNGASGYPSATFFLAGPGSSVYHNPTLSVIRERTLGKGRGEDLHEKLTVINCGREDIVIELSMTFDADFADLFEVKNKQLIKKGTISRRVRRPRSRIDLPAGGLRTPDHHPCRWCTGESRFGGLPLEAEARRVLVGNPAGLIRVGRATGEDRCCDRTAGVQDQAPARRQSPRPDGRVA